METGSENLSVHISVIMATYNMSSHLGEAIDSVLCGNFPDCEVLVIDDGSTDNTNEVIAQYTDKTSSRFDSRVIYRYQENSGKAAAVNLGLTIARGTYITILDADDNLTANSIAVRYKQAISADGDDHDLVIGSFATFDEGGICGERLLTVGQSPQELIKEFYTSFRTPFHLNACLISRRLVDVVGKLDTRLLRCQDIDYSLRLLMGATNLTCINQIVYLYRRHREVAHERLKYRLKTMRHRWQVYSKNFDGSSKVRALCSGLLLDFSKAIYEISGNYKG